MSSSSRLVVVLSTKIPDPTTGGGDYTVLGMVSGLLELGYRVLIVATHQIEAESRELLELKKKYESDLEWSNCLASIQISAGHRVLDNIAGGLISRSAVTKILGRAKPVLAIAYNYPAANVLKLFKKQFRCETLCLLGDPPHLPAAYRTLAAKFRGDLQFLELCIKQVADSRYGKKILSNIDSSRDCVDRIYACAAHHAKDYEGLFGRRVNYARTPVWRESVIQTPESWVSIDTSKSNILHMGHLSGTATSNGVDGLIKGLKALTNADISDIAFHLVGGRIEKLDSELALQISSLDCVSVHGETKRPELWYSHSTALIVPISIPLGIRVRVLTAMAYGCPVIVHKANKNGIPELAHRENCIIYDDDENVIEVAIKTVRDKDLLPILSSNGLKTYESLFKAETAMQQVIDSGSRT